MRDIIMIAWIFAFIISIGYASASLTATNITGTYLTADTSCTNTIDGITIRMAQNTSLYNVTALPAVTYDTIYVFDTALNNMVARSQVKVGNDYYFNASNRINLTKNTLYAFGGNGTGKTRVVMSLTHPFNTTFFNTTGRVDCGVLRTDNYYHNVQVFVTGIVEGSPPPASVSYNISNIQTPPDISSTTLTITLQPKVYNMSNSNFTAQDYMELYFTPFTYLNNGCSIFYGPTCYHYSSTYFVTNMTKTNDGTSGNFAAFQQLINDNQLFPAYYPFNYDYINGNPGLNYTAYNNNNIRFLIQNFSTLMNYTFLSIEMDAVNDSSSTASMLIYYCNSTYVTGNPLTSANCELVSTYLPQSWNHVHNFSRHGIVRFQVLSVGKTQNSSIVFVSPNILPANGWNFRYVTNSSYDNRSFQIGNFNSWSATPNIFDVHLHQYMPQDYFTYYYKFYDGAGNSNTSIQYYDFYNITQYLPTTPLILNCSNNHTFDPSFLNFENINITWTNSSDANNDPTYYMLKYYNQLGLSTLCNTTSTSCAFNTSIFISGGIYPLLLQACDPFGCSSTDTSCSIDMCLNNYVDILQPCTDGVRLKLYQDDNHCSRQYNIPSDNGTLSACSVTIYQQQTYTPDMLMLIILAFFIIVSIVCAIFVHEAFFGLTALLFALGIVVFLTYDYPQLLIFADIFMILLFIVMWIVIHKARR